MKELCTARLQANTSPDAPKCYDVRRTCAMLPGSLRADKKSLVMEVSLQLLLEILMAGHTQGLPIWDPEDLNKFSEYSNCTN